jgi:hypothetical protein
MRVGRLTISLFLAGALLLAAVIGIGTRSSSQPMGLAPARPGTPARFTYLAGRGSNRCDLDWHSIGSMSSDWRLQGSCCAAMDETRYRRQVAALRRYRAAELIPRDPYDISVALAKRLLRLRSQIRLAPAERSTYRRALATSPEHGPCCCHCWRWEAFSGLGKYLIHERHWPAPRLASLIGDLDGCGGTA